MLINNNDNKLITMKYAITRLGTNIYIQTRLSTNVRMDFYPQMEDTNILDVENYSVLKEDVIINYSRNYNWTFRAQMLS